MIKNIVFDMGNVLIRFLPERFIEMQGKTEEDSGLLMEQIFRAPEWAKMDDGSLVEEDFLKLLHDKLPEHLQDAAYQLVMCWDEPILPVEGMEDLVCRLKEQGYKIYLLSNASVRQHKYWDRIPGSCYFDGTLISADVKMVKPDSRIYQELFRTFDMKPEESIFIDDSPANIAGSKSQGMDGFIFTGDVNALWNWIEEKTKGR